MATLTGRKSMEPFLLDDVEFYPHQVEGIRKLMRWKSFLLGDDMGLGKSLQALTVFIGDVFTGQGQTCLVVCPVSLRANWANEIEKFTRIPYMLLGEELNPRTGKTRVLSSIERSMQIVEFANWNKAKILVLNYEQVIAHLGELNALKARCAIFDEAHTIKNHEAKRTKACLELKADRSFMLTGTPVLNQVHELWPILHRISPKHFPNPYAFKNRYCVYGGYKNKQVVGVKNLKELQAILDQVMLRRLKKDVLDLPEVQYVDVYVDLHPNQRKLYDKIDMEFEIDSMDPNSPPEKINGFLTQFLRLKQVCGTPATLGHPDESYKLDAVIERAVEVISTGEKLVIFTQFRPVLAAVVARLHAAGIPVMELHGDVKRHDRQSVVDEWSAYPGGAVIVCMIQIAGVGLNMTAARRAFRVDKLVVPGLNTQAVDRLHRIGQSKTQPVQITDFIARHTIEQRVEEINRKKIKLFNNIIEDVNVFRELLKALREKSAA